MQSVTSNAVAEALDDTVANERSFYYGAVARGDHTRPVKVSYYEAGIICAIRQGVGTGVFAFTTNGNGNGFATTNLLSGANIIGYMSRNNKLVTIDNGAFTVLQW